MDSIFPFTDPVEIENEEIEVPMAKEWAWDFEKMDFKTKGGKMYLVEGAEAVKIWLWKLLNTNRYRELIYNWDYGHELEELIGQGYSQSYLDSEAERYIREAIEYNLSEYVLDIEDLEIEFINETLKVEFTAITPYGEVDISV